MKCCGQAWWSVLLVVAAVWLAPNAPGWALDSTADGRGTAEEAEATDVEPQIARLIEQLGASDFAEREKAQAELTRLGLEAFDALIDAEKSDDIEIQLRARYLVRSMNVRWFVDGDSPEVVRILKGYGDSPDNDRKNRMERLSKLPERQGLAPLVRLARFEKNAELSKRAALLAMSVEEPTSDDTRRTAAKQIEEAIGTSKRPVGQWLRTYAKTLLEPQAMVDQWETIVKAEQDVLAHQPEQTSREILRDLFRWQVAMLQKLNRDEEAIAAIRRTVDLLDGTTEQVTEIVDWLVQREAWPAVQEVADRFPGAFSDSPLLLYRLAETQLKSGKPELANQTAEKALGLREDRFDEHLLVGFRLQERGLFDWAEREYRMIADKAPAGTRTNFKSRFLLSELLHDHQRDQDAAEVLQPIADLMDKDEAAKGEAVNADRDWEAIYARLNFFRAQHAQQQGKIDETRSFLLKALEYDATDADVLISLYRLKNDDTQAADAKSKIEHATDVYRKEIEEFSESLEGANNAQEKAIYSIQVATSCNQFAWLVSNTFGDFSEALRASHRSLELRPETAGYLDTLGRCYYANGELENAVKYQRQAAKLDPHSRAITRQLEQFERELKEKGDSAASEAPATDGPPADESRKSQPAEKRTESP
jgi:tetratricopeptide (TPR) repeat protein